MDLTKYDSILISTSAGKDSQTMLRFVVQMAEAQGVADRLVAVHADLGRAEWAGTAELAERQADHYGVRFEKISRPKGDLVTQIETRGMFPDSARRYCTSDQKRDQVIKVMTMLHREFTAAGGTGTFRLLDCQGLRAQESAARAKKQASGPHKKATTLTREVTTWYPILSWTEDEVWADILDSGVEYHSAYDLGMPRLSCVFCVFAPKSALVIAGKANPELLDEYVRIEEKIGHDFTEKLSIREVRDLIRAGVEVEADEDESWNM